MIFKWKFKISVAHRGAEHYLGLQQFLKSPIVNILAGEKLL